MMGPIGNMSKFDVVFDLEIIEYRLMGEVSYSSGNKQTDKENLYSSTVDQVVCHSLKTHKKKFT